MGIVPSTYGPAYEYEPTLIMKEVCMPSSLGPPIEKLPDLIAPDIACDHSWWYGGHGRRCTKCEEYRPYEGYTQPANVTFDGRVLVHWDWWAPEPKVGF